MSVELRLAGEARVDLADFRKSLENLTVQLIADGYRVVHSGTIEDRDPGDEHVEPSRWVVERSELQLFYPVLGVEE